MVTRRVALALAASLVLLGPAAAIDAYDKAKFDEALKSGAPLVVHVHADWCPVCRRQEPILKSLSTDSATSGARQFVVNFDKEKAFLTANNVPSQSVILVFKGGKETARLAGETDAAKIKSTIVAGIK
jgi:thiol-disulfide isomerase/thioredoxin